MRALVPKRQAPPGAPFAWFYHVLRHSNSTDVAEMGRGKRTNASVLKAISEDVSVAQRAVEADPQAQGPFQREQGSTRNRPDGGMQEPLPIREARRSVVKFLVDAA